MAEEPGDEEEPPVTDPEPEPDPPLPNDDSILYNIKKLIGMDYEYQAFDMDLTIHINSVFATLNQLGIGPIDGFIITGYDELWSDFTDSDKKLSSVKSLVYLRVKLQFDPPETSYARDSMDKMAKEYEWRLNVYEEGIRHPL